MTTVSLRFEDEMKQELDEICDAMGISITTLFTIYAKKVIRDRRIPFIVEAPSPEAKVEMALDAADAYAKAVPARMLHEEVFSGLRGRINE